MLTLVGIVDPPRPTAKDSDRDRARGPGIQVRMITGDHAVTAEAIARKLGIEGRAITGAEFGAMTDEEARRADRRDRRDRPGHPGAQGAARRDAASARATIVAMTGDGVNERPALKKADIGIAMGITGTEVSKEAAAMILTDDNFATIVKAVELGRGLYDNLTKYIRFQMGVLAGMILTFLGASIFNIVGGVPFIPLQTLWVNFTTQVFQSVGLGYGRSSDGRDGAQAARARTSPCSIGRCFLLARDRRSHHGRRNAGPGPGAEDHHGKPVARTLALTDFSICNLFFSFTALDERRSVFTMESFADRKFLFATGLSVVGDRARDRAGRPEPVPPDDRPQSVAVGPRPGRPDLDRPRLGGLEVVPAPAGPEARGGRGRRAGRRRDSELSDLFCAARRRAFVVKVRVFS